MIQSLSLDQRIQAFIELGKVLGKAADTFSPDLMKQDDELSVLHYAILNSTYHNPWFTNASIKRALSAWSDSLTRDALHRFVKVYDPALFAIETKHIAVIMAGNIPLVGFHDFLCVLLSGNSFLGKLSSDDHLLLPAVAKILCEIEPGFNSFIDFTRGTLTGFDAIIATGSNNTARYFEYYFSKYPHIIRKNRNSVAVLSGNENDETLKLLGSDICTYFGLGCRNVSKVFIPVGFKPERLFVAIEPYISALFDHFKYMNNYSYYRSIYLINSTKHLDNGVFILKESDEYVSPIPVLFYEFYTDLESVKKKLLLDKELVQCVVNEMYTDDVTVGFGDSQSPGLADFADGVDTIKFLLNL